MPSAFSDCSALTGSYEQTFRWGQQAQIKPRPAWLERAGESLRTETYETAKLRFPGYDIYHVESEWRTWS
ncbi:MAG: hypothetical protein KUG81_10260, partial [Gammaproteobacteria bacterium]|nr:hypothetical protein [Gammaproteobacteria bacterium]